MSIIKTRKIISTMVFILFIVALSYSLFMYGSINAICAENTDTYLFTESNLSNVSNKVSYNTVTPYIRFR